MHFLNKYFLLNDHHTAHDEVAHWRVSALRIILTLVTLLCFLVVCYTYTRAIEFNLIYIAVITISFFTIALSLLLASKRFYTFSANALLLTIVAGSLSMNLFLTDLELAKVGSMFMYSCPIIALMLLGYRTALAYGILNIIPFYMIINNVDLSGYSGIASQLPETGLYITGLIFLFFNICIPLATARTIVAAKRLNKTMLNANSFLKDKNELYRTLFTESNKAKIIVDENLVITDLNQHAIEMFGLKNSLKEKAVRIDGLFPALNSKELNIKNQIIEYKNRYYKSNFQQIAMSTNYRVYDFYDCTQEQLIKQNLSMMEQENKRLRFRDSQTKLPNREWFEMQCDRLTSKYQKGFYIVVTQSANSEYLNLKLNKADSQSLLITAYKRLKAMSEGPLLCAHIEGGKLGFIIGSSSSEQQNKLLIQIKSTLDQTYDVFGTNYQQSFLFGFAKCPEHGENSAIVLSNACEALKLADYNLPFNGYNQKQSQAFMEKYEISMLLDEALQQNDLSVHYQPKVDAKGECIGLEALARWHSSVLGCVSPAVFIPIAEEYRMISRLTDLIIQKVCAQIAQWSKVGLPLLPVAINISLLDFSQADFMSKLVKYLADFNVKPNQIELELTETSLEANQVHSLKLMQTLQDWGFTITVDDFGVGYSNIARLADYPIDKLKLDRSLISKVTSSTRQKSLVKAMHVMCDELNIKCVAEGVETEEQVLIMSEMGCKEFQGYYFSKPMSAQVYAEYINQNGLFFTAKNLASAKSS